MNNKRKMKKKKRSALLEGFSWEDQVYSSQEEIAQVVLFAVDPFGVVVFLIKIDKYRKGGRGRSRNSRKWQ
jgi:hypothetical protein